MKHWWTNLLRGLTVRPDFQSLPWRVLGTSQELIFSSDKIILTGYNVLKFASGKEGKLTCESELPWIIQTSSLLIIVLGKGRQSVLETGNQQTWTVIIPWVHGSRTNVSWITFTEKRLDWILSGFPSKKNYVIFFRVSSLIRKFICLEINVSKFAIDPLYFIMSSRVGIRGEAIIFRK